MSRAEAVQTTKPGPSSSVSGIVLQRKCACGGSAGFSGECNECKTNKLLGQPLQKKLAISERGDEYEQEADRVAEQVMQIPSADTGKEEREGINHPVVQHRVSGSGTDLVEAPPIVHDVLGSSGQPLDSVTRAFFEPRFGQDFSTVRIHSDALAAESARSVNALAYTVGDRVAFSSRCYSPHTHEGRRLLAHELVHVVQQGQWAINNRKHATSKAMQPMLSPVSTLQRQEAHASPPCITGKTEGEGFNLLKSIPIPMGQPWVYGIWGKYNKGEAVAAVSARAFRKWVDWRFGKLSTERRAWIQDYLTAQPIIHVGPALVPDCYYMVGLSQDIYSRARVLAGEAKQAPLPDETTAPLYNVVAGTQTSGAAPPATEESTKAERGAPLPHNWSVLDKNEPLSRKYLLWMQHFVGLPKSTRADELATDGLSGNELNEIIGGEPRFTYYTDLITQGYSEFKADGGIDLDNFNPLVELVLQQFTWGNPTATKNLLRIGKGDSWVPEEKGKIGVAHRTSGLLLYDETGTPLRSISGMQWRDSGYIGAPQPKGWGINIADVKDPALFSLLNMLRQNIGDPQRQVAVAAQVLFENVDMVKMRVVNGLPTEVVQKFEDSLPMFVGFLAGHGLAQLLVMSANPYLVAVGGALKGLLTAAGYIMDIDFAASAMERLLLAARYLSRVTRDDSGKMTTLSEHYLDVAAVPLRDMVADIALLTATAAFGRLMKSIGGRGKERPKIECHSCSVEPKTGEAKPKGEEAKGDAGAPKEVLTGRAAATKETYLTVLQEIQDLTRRLADLRKEQAASPTPERARAIRAMEAELKDLGTDANKYLEKRAKEDEAIRKSSISLYEKIRAATPSTKAAELVLRRAKGLDQYSGQPTSKLTVDHLVPIKDIVNMEGFDKLTWEQQKSMVDTPENLFAMDGPANSSKGDRSWSEWTQWADFYKDPKIKNDMVARDAAVRSKIQAEIARLSK